MNSKDKTLIVGAGPVGLGAALFLARQGRNIRIIDMQETPSYQSRALAVNPRTLEILESTGLTQRLINAGLLIHGIEIHIKKRTIRKTMSGLHPKYPFMLALSQAATERFLTMELEVKGVHVERGIKLSGCQAFTERVEALLKSGSGGGNEAVECSLLLAADGAHSEVRKQLDINFEGTSLPNEWYLADAPLKTRLLPSLGHIFFLDEGVFLFLIRVIDNTLNEDPEKPYWRVISNRPDPLNLLLEAEQAGPSIWSSSFHISHRINSTMAQGNIYFAGDAAHIHSPMGARGMNLGLEDAWVFSELFRTGRLSEYNLLRRPVDEQVVRNVKFLTRVVTAEAGFYYLMKIFIFPNFIRIPFLWNVMRLTLTGLDHELSVLDE